MTTTEMLAKWNKRLPLVISESGWGRTDCDWFDVLSDVDRKTRETGPGIRGEFHYIRLSHGFEDILTSLLQSARSFIDIGCGAGDKLHWVKNNFPSIDVYGIEHDPAMAIWAGEYGSVACGDAFDISYKSFDVIYAYWPIANSAKMIELIKHVLATKAKESVFVLFGFEDRKGIPVPSLKLRGALIWQ